jgi:N-acyl amino acid synthase of PEP-CTERM/exosortase system
MDKSKHRKFLAKLGTIIGEKSKAARLITSHAKLKEADRISSHFFSYFETVIANSEELREKVFRIRHEVYCEELNFEPVKESCLEFDEFDRYSLHCLIQQRSSKHSAGVVRMVRPVSSNQLLPIEKYCLNSITRKELDPSQFSREHICEISRLAIPKNFRRRVLDDFNGAGVGAINQQSYSEIEVRCFPFIAVGLYLAAAALTIEEDIRHTYVMMEPRLARSMGFIGIKFEQIGPVVEYHGKRAPFYINPDLLMKSLRPGFAKMLTDVLTSIEKQC